MKMKRTLLALLVAVSLALGLSGSALTQNSEELREELHRTLPLTAAGRISLENISGTVKITSWERNEIKIDAVKRAFTRQRLDDAQIEIDADGDHVRIGTEFPEKNYRVNGDNPRDAIARVDYTLTVPRNARLEEIEMVNGSLEIENVSGDVKASVVNGSVRAHGLMGEAKLSTVNGDLQVVFDRLDASKPISLGSVSGPLTVVIPSDANAQLRANTVSGSITNDFGLPVRRGEYVGRDLSGTLGQGGPRIKLSNVSGPIYIRRAADGRPLSPATNLLSEDNDDDDDRDVDDEREARREADRAARDSAREVARAQREAQREAQRAQLEGQRATREAQAEAARQAREAQLEAQEAAREAQAEARAEAARALAEARREARDNARAGRDAAREAERERGLYSNDGDLRLVERESKSFTVTGVPRVVLNTFDGRISIRSWDKQEVMLTAIKRAGNEQALRGISVKADQRGSEVNIMTGYDKNAGRRFGGLFSPNASVALEVFVPRNSNIQALSGDGRVEMEGVSGGVQLQTGDGRIEVHNSSGQLIAKTGDGRIEIDNYTGDVDARTGDGRISLIGRFAQLAARTGGGAITLEVPADLNATIETNAESVHGEGVTLEPDNGVGKRPRRFRLGRGGNVFRLNTDDGAIFLRQQ